MRPASRLYNKPLFSYSCLRGEQTDGQNHFTSTTMLRSKAWHSGLRRLIPWAWVQIHQLLCFFFWWYTGCARERDERCCSDFILFYNRPKEGGPSLFFFIVKLVCIECQLILKSKILFLIPIFTIRVVPSRINN